MAVKYVSKTTDGFWKLFYKLEHQLQKTARNKYEIFKKTPHCKSLRFKQIGRMKARKNPWWEISINECYRAVGIQKGNENIIHWFWVGDHTKTERLIRQG